MDADTVNSINSVIDVYVWAQADIILQYNDIMLGALRLAEVFISDVGALRFSKKKNKSKTIR